MRVLFIGGDKRMSYAAEHLAKPLDIERLGLGDSPAPNGKFDVIVLPLPLTKNGSEIFAPLSEKPLPFEVVADYAEENAVIFAGGECAALTRLCEDLSYKLVNYFASEALTLKNAALTAEAACALLSQSTDGALLGSSVLITGYGRIARFLADRLKAFGCDVTVAARREEQRVTARLDGFAAIPTDEIISVLEKFDHIANTVPSALFSEREFSKMKETCVFMELASLPEEPTRSLASDHDIKYIFASGLPGKYSPKAAGEYIADEITGNLKVLQIPR